MSFIPEKALGWAIVKRAVSDSLGLGVDRVTQREARAWVFSIIGAQTKEPWGFSWWCDQLGVSAVKIHRFIDTFPDRRVSGCGTDDNLILERIWKEAS